MFQAIPDILYQVFQRHYIRRKRQLLFYRGFLLAFLQFIQFLLQCFQASGSNGDIGLGSSFSASIPTSEPRHLAQCIFAGFELLVISGEAVYLRCFCGSKAFQFAFSGFNFFAQFVVTHGGYVCFPGGVLQRRHAFGHFLHAFFETFAQVVVLYHQANFLAAKFHVFVCVHLALFPLHSLVTGSVQTGSQHPFGSSVSSAIYQRLLLLAHRLQLHFLLRLLRCQHFGLSLVAYRLAIVRTLADQYVVPLGGTLMVAQRITVFLIQFLHLARFVAMPFDQFGQGGYLHVYLALQLGNRTLVGIRTVFQ